LPEAQFDERVMIVPGTDGQKMSKSYNNYIDIFLADKELRKNVMKITTDSKPLEEPKNPDTCNVFSLYKLMGTEEQVVEMRANYEGGNYGYGHAKQALFELIAEKYRSQRELYWKLMEDKELLDQELAKGAVKARKIAQEVLARVRAKIGY
jgi:tryptophanyl-tRNA synthetase